MKTERQLKSMLLSAVDILRGTDKSSHLNIEIVSRLFLLKRLSDVFEEKAEVLEKKTGDRNLAWNNPKLHDFFVPEEARWDSLRHLKQDIGEKLNQAISALEYFNPKLKGIFSSFDFSSKNLAFNSRKGDNILSKLILEFSDCSLRDRDLENRDVVGQVYDHLLEKAATVDLTRCEFGTPSNIANLLVSLLNPHTGMSICDPTCGSGGFLVECARQIQQRRGDVHQVSFYGQEVSSHVWVFAQINMLLHDIPNFDIRQGNTIREPKLVKDGALMQFDIVLADPPFSIGDWGQETAMVDNYHRFRYGIPPKSAGDFAFIQHILATLNSTGRAAMLVPNGVLFRGSSEGEIRERILKADLVEAVIGLPSNLHYRTAIPTAIIIFNYNKPKERRDRVLIVDASKYSHTDQKRNYFTDEDIIRIVSAYTNFIDEEGFAKVISLDEFVKNGYILNVNRYVLLPKLTIDAKAEVAKLRTLKTQLAEAEKKFNKCLKELGTEI